MRATACRSAGSLVSGALASRYSAIIFDKDGTLLDFAASWNPAIHDAVCKVAGPTNSKLQSDIAAAIGYDMALRAPLPDAPIIHASNSEVRRAQIID